MPKEELFELFISKKEFPNLVDERGIQYIFEQKNARRWEVRKLEDSHCTIYHIGLIKETWLCSCPSGTRGRVCKHATWIRLLNLPKVYSR